MQKGLRWFVIALVVFGTLTVLKLKVPEERMIRSDDGFVYVVGDFLHSDADFSLAAVASSIDAKFTAVIPPVYQFYPSDRILSTPARLYFHYDPDVVDERALQIGFYDDAFGMWRLVDTEVSATDRIASVLLDHFGKWALMKVEDVARPNFDAEVESLISAPPSGAMGYEIAIGYATVPGDFVMLSGAGKTGGCAKQYKIGKSTQMTSRAVTFSDALEYQVVAVWQIGDGCQGYEVIE